MDPQAASACYLLTTPPTTTALSLEVTRWAVPVPAVPAGRPRMRHTPDAAAPTCIIPDEEPLPLPPEVHYGLTYVARLGWLQLDAFALAEQAHLLFARAAPKVGSFNALCAQAAQINSHLCCSSAASLCRCPCWCSSRCLVNEALL